MKSLLASVLLWFSVCLGHSATSGGGPVTYHMLNTNDFRVDGSGTVWVRLQSQGGTNLFITNLFTQTIVTTNFYVTNYISGDTIVTITTNVYLTNTYLFLNGTNVATVNPTDNYLPKRASATNFVNSLAHDDGTTFSIDGTGTSFLRLESDDGQIVFGTGGTNVLFRNSNQLVYTNGSTSGNGVNFEVRNGNGVAAMFGVDEDPQAFVRAPAGKFFRVEPNGGNPVYDFTSTALYPEALASLGVEGKPWGTNFYLAGFVSGTNNSKLLISHTGTNGAIVFDSQSVGTAGPPRPFQFTNEVLHVDSTKGIELGGVTRTTWPAVAELSPVLATMQRSVLLTTNISLLNASPALHDLWDVPSGYWAYLAILNTATTNDVTGKVDNYVKTNSVYYRLYVSNVANTTNTTSNNGINYVYEENETISISNTVQGLNFRAQIKYWPKSVPYLKVIKQFGTTAASTNVVYTCPAGVQAHGGQDIFLTPFPSWSGIGPIQRVYNGHGSSIVCDWFAIPVGSVADSTTKATRATVTTGSIGSGDAGVLYPGESLAFCCDTTSANVICSFFVIECP